ncbi:MAG: hypothetical protein ACOX6T_17800 [Myxococcales bacterium]
MRRTLLTPTLLLALSAVLVSGCGDEPEAPADAGVVDAGEKDAGEPPKREPPDPALAAVELVATPGETSVSLSWSVTYDVAGVERWVIDWGEKGAGFPNTFEAGSVDASSATLEGLEVDKTYELFISGLTASGHVAPEPGDDGERPAGSFLAQSVAIEVKTVAPKFGPPHEVLNGQLDSAILLPLGARSFALVYRQERDLYVALSDDRGASFGRKLPVDTFVQNVSAAVDPQRGILVVCYKKTEGIFVATSLDRGLSFQTKPLAAEEGPGCSVTFAMGAFLVASEHQSESKIFVRRSEDGMNFEPAIVGAEVVNSGSADPVIIADPLPRTVDAQQAQMVYLAWVQQRTTGMGGTDIYVSSSRDGGRSFLSESGHVIQQMVNEPIVSAESNPTLAVDLEDGRLWVAWEDRKSTPLILLATSGDFCKTRPSGALTWKPGSDLASQRHDRVNPSLRVRPGGKLLVAFASGPAPDERVAYVTQFAMAADGKSGQFEPPQSGAELSLKVGENALASDTRDTSDLAGPYLAADPAVGEHMVWTTNAMTIQGNIELASSPQL